MALRRMALEVKLGLRGLSGPRMRPELFIIGAQKAGTTTLFGHLARHPQVLAPLVKEVHYFDVAMHRAARWYGAHFPLEGEGAQRQRETGLPVMTFDTTPYYIFQPDVAARIAAFAPHAKIIAVLRDPVDRAWSHYWHEWGRGFEKLGPIEALQAEVTRLPTPHDTAGATAHERMMHQHFSYVSRSEYDRQIVRWLAVFPREQLLFLKSETLFTDPAGSLGRVADFLGLAPFAETRPKVLNSGDYDAAPAQVRDWLEQRLGASMKAVRDLLGEEMAWP